MGALKRVQRVVDGEEDIFACCDDSDEICTIKSDVLGVVHFPLVSSVTEGRVDTKYMMQLS